nr:hypothetical protein [Tanacetum cinerariifolium]
MGKIEKSEEELEMFKALEHKSVVMEVNKHNVVVFTKAHPRECSESFMRFFTPCVVDGQEEDIDIDTMLASLVEGMDEIGSASNELVNMGKHNVVVFTKAHPRECSESFMRGDVGKLGFVRLNYGGTFHYVRKRLLGTTKCKVDFGLGEIQIDLTMLEEDIDIDTMLASLVEDILVDKDLSLLLGRPFLRTCGAIIDMGRGTMTINDEVIRHTYFPKPRAKSYLENCEVDEDEDWLRCFEVGRDEDGNPKYGSVAPSFLDI